MNTTTRPIVERFWEKVDKKGPDECWNWTAYKDHEGYGVFGANRKNFRAHKIAYELHYKVNVRNLILHKCDNPSCCNPSHLFDGTQYDNMMDMISKGRKRTAKGESLPQHKLTCEDVVKIRSDTRPDRIVARDYSVSRRAISFVQSRTTWNHVP